MRKSQQQSIEGAIALLGIVLAPNITTLIMCLIWFLVCRHLEDRYEKEGD